MTASIEECTESQMPREGSRYGIEDYMEIKYMCMGGLNAAA